MSEQIKVPSKLIHVKLENGMWAWKCPICNKFLAPTPQYHKGGGGTYAANFQSKGAASRHLMTHNYNLVQHHRTHRNITYRYHKLKLTNTQIVELKLKGSIEYQRKGMFSNYDMLAVAQNGTEIGHVTADLNFDKTWALYKASGSTITYGRYDNLIYTITFIKEN